MNKIIRLGMGLVISLMVLMPMTFTADARPIENQTCAITYITSVWELQNMSDNLAGDYELSNNISAAITSTWNGGIGFISIGTWVNQFTGTFNGNNYTISNLYINRTSYYSNPEGLFGYIKNSEIKNINMVDVNIYTLGDHKAGLVGYADNSHISNCSVTGRIIVTVTMDGCAGGLLGWGVTGTTIDDCYTDVYISAPDMVGGIAGYIGGVNAGYINRSYSTGTLICSNSGGGGIVGQNYAYVINCYSTINIAGNIIVGGISGYGNPWLLINCYYAGNITFTNFGDAIMYGTPVSVDGLYFDSEITGLSSSIYADAKTTEEMMMQSTFKNNGTRSEGWDFDNIWGIIEAETYPYLQWQDLFMGGEDLISPVITNLTITPNPSEYNDTLNFTVVVTDDIGVDSVYINITGLGNYSMSEGLNDEWYLEMIIMLPGINNVTIWANDTSNNWNYTTETFTMEDEIINLTLGQTMYYLFVGILTLLIFILIIKIILEQIKKSLWGK
jgi:hypothetical protein